MSCLLSPLKSPGIAVAALKSPAQKFAAVKLGGAQVGGVVMARVKVFVALAPEPPPLKALTRTMYVPAGCASVTRTMPVVGSASNLPWKPVEAETSILVVLAGVASGIIVVLVLSGSDVSE